MGSYHQTDEAFGRHDERPPEEALREREIWLAGQRAALETALGGAPLDQSLGHLVRTATAWLGEGVRAAFYLGDSEAKTLHHIVGMGKAYAEAVDGFDVGPESLACGLAAHLGLPVITPDVSNEPRWAPWLWLAEKFGYRGCWSFPISTRTGSFVGTFAVFWRDPRELAPRDLELTALLVPCAAMIIARHLEAELRGRAEAALRASEARLAALFEGLPIGIGTMTTDGVATLSNAALRRYLPTGVVPSRDPARVGRWRSWSAQGEPVPPRDFPTARSLRGEMVLPGMEMLFTGDDGAETWTLVTAVPIRDDDGNITSSVTTIADIDPQKRAQEALAHSEVRFRQFADASSDAVLIRNADTLQLEYANPAFETVYGLTRAEIERGDIGITWSELVLGEDRDAAIASIERVKAGESLVFRYRIRRPSDGEVRWLRDAAFPLRDAKGRTVRIGGLSHDETDERRSAERTQVMVGELQHRTRNLIGVVRAICHETLIASSSSDAFATRFGERLEALSRVQGLLSRSEIEPITIRALLTLEINALGSRAMIERATLAGPEIRLRPSTVQTLALVIHELATNARKYGALAAADGALSIAWRQEGSNLDLVWMERGIDGESVRSARPGYGRRLIEQALPYSHGATTEYELSEESLRCRILLPLGASRTTRARRT
jgi:PAS domain S-box-containing protein